MRIESKEASISAERPIAVELPDYPWPRETMTVAEVAATIRFTAKTVRQHIRGGRLRAVQFEEGGPYSVHRDDAQAWVAAFVVDQQAREGLDRTVARRRSLLAGTPRPTGVRSGSGGR